MLKFGIFCHFLKDHSALEKLVSLNDQPNINGLGAMYKISLSTQAFRKRLTLGMIVHFHIHPSVNIYPIFSISNMSCFVATRHKEYIMYHNGAFFFISSITCCIKLNLSLKIQISFRFEMSFRSESVFKIS